MPFFENVTLGAIDDCAGARSAIYESVRVLAARLRLELTDDDVAELQNILAAADRMHRYHQAIRADISAMEQARRGRR